ncbi:MAG: SCP2 sterol-binding domain-containing protein [Proteobacteria bacterium]|nr:SCP2 sterol-binding domain-containing protein [Pseudomonadota bacterium]MDE3207777.1 SCP2 sterol-binding domain-containing protein [Pseudomonadota bacterium]
MAVNPSADRKQKGLLARIMSSLPQWPPSRVFVMVLNFAFQRCSNGVDLAGLEGHVFQIQVVDLGFKLTFERTQKCFAAAGHHRIPDLVISAASRDFWSLIQGREDPDTLFFNRKLLIEGDTELGLLAKNIIESISWPSLKY